MAALAAHPLLKAPAGCRLERLEAVPRCCRARRRRCRPLAAALPPPPPPPALTVAALVPQFPRIGGQPVKDWIGQMVDNMEGFNGDDLGRLLTPDLRGLEEAILGLFGSVPPTTLAIGLILLVAFAYWEGGILLNRLRARQAAERRQRELERRRRQGEEPAEEPAPQEPDERHLTYRSYDRHKGQHPEWTELDWARHERRRGLGWLALTTAGLIWLTGVVNNPTPFQP